MGPPWCSWYWWQAGGSEGIRPVLPLLVGLVGGISTAPRLWPSCGLAVVNAFTGRKGEPTVHASSQLTHQRLGWNHRWKQHLPQRNDVTEHGSLGNSM
jgi:hypothetical protein